MTTYRINFTKDALSKGLELPAKGKRHYYYDVKERGLILDLTSNGSKSFFLYKRINGKPERVFLGKFPDISVENARKAAAKAKGEIAQGANPQEKRRALRSEITFGEMFFEYMERYSKREKKSWQHDQREVPKFLSHWFDRKASQITTQEIRMLHEKVGHENGRIQANRIFERIKAIYNKAIEWGWKGDNPANGIKKYKEKSRDRFMQADEMPRFFKAIAEEPNETARDYILVSLLTGARKSNVLAMRWEEINFTTAQWRIPESKNGDPLYIPLVRQALEILQKRRVTTNSEWVFSSDISKSGHFSDPKKAWKRVLNSAGIENLRLHDLRRTLGSWQAATGATTAMIGKSLGHKSQQATAIYERLNIDPIRNTMSIATEAMFDAGKK